MLSFVAQPGLAENSSGYAALALGMVVGSYSPGLSIADKAVLTRLVGSGSGPRPTGRRITINADAIKCRAGSVDIAAFTCELTFSSRTVALSGRQANELFAVISEAGVPGDGAAGHIDEALHQLHCIIDPALVRLRDGSGADCRFELGPG